MTAPTSTGDAAIEAAPSTATGPSWPLWQRVLLRFFFVYLLLQITPWNWFAIVPGVEALGNLWSRLLTPRSWPRIARSSTSPIRWWR